MIIIDLENVLAVDEGQVGSKQTETLPQPPENRHSSPKSKGSSSSYRPFHRVSDKGLFDRGSRSSSRRPPPQSKAQTFDDVLLDMSPAGQRLRAIQKLIAQQLGPAAAFMDVQFMDEPNGDYISICFSCQFFPFTDYFQRELMN